jgi:alpha-mannosidase
MSQRPTVHLICNAHLDPVWQWRWEEGCAEALSTFATAVEVLKAHPTLIFNHNEAVLYQWRKSTPRRFSPRSSRSSPQAAGASAAAGSCNPT